MMAAAFVTGVLASMGVGGGMVLIVYLTVFSGISQLEAQGINLLYFIPIAALSVLIHTRGKLIEWKKIIPSLITGIIGSAAGCMLAYYFGSEQLGKIFAVFIIIIGIKELFYTVL